MLKGQKGLISLVIAPSYWAKKPMHTTMHKTDEEEITRVCTCDQRHNGYLGDADAVDPLVQSPDVLAAEVLDVLGFLLDLRMLGKQHTGLKDTPHEGKELKPRGEVIPPVRITHWLFKTSVSMLRVSMLRVFFNERQPEIPYK